MNREQIIRMAREAGMQPYYDAQSPAIERFAALVAAAEREVCAKIAESWATEETEITCENISRAIRRHPCKGARMTDAEIDNLWLEAFKASSDDGKVRQRFAELCYQKGAAEMKEQLESKVCDALNLYDRFQSQDGLDLLAEMVSGHKKRA